MKNKLSLKSIIMLLLCAYTAAGYIVFAAAGKIIPMPFAEGAAFIYWLIKEENILLSAILIAVLLFSIGAVVYLALFSYKRFYPLRASAALFAAADCAIHLYVFFFSRGFVWSYIVSASLDVVLIALLFVKEKSFEDEQESN